MESRINPPGVDTGTIPQPAVVIGALVLCCLVYGFASGSGSGRYQEADRIVVAECWKAVERKAGSDQARRELSDGCSRMERGFHMKYGWSF